MPRPAYSIDLPSPKLFDDSRSEDQDSELHFELRDLDVPGHGRSVSQPSIVSAPVISWKTLPHKNQLGILAFTVFADFFHAACLQTVVFHQLRSFDEKASDAKIAWQAGILQGSFMAGQTVSAAVWERIADSTWGGRKRTLLASFAGTFISCVALASAGTFRSAIVCRILGGFFNSTAATARKTVVEMVETKFHPRALIILPMASNVAYVVSPLLSGLVSDMYQHHLSLFGPKSPFGGKKGLRWLKDHPYAPPYLLSAIILAIGGALIYLGLVETLAARQFFSDPGLDLAAALKRRLPNRFRRKKRTHYTRLSLNDALLFESPSSAGSEGSGSKQKPESRSKHKRSVSVRRTWTASTFFTLVATGLLHFHIGAFAALWPIFLSISSSISSNFPTFLYHAKESAGGLSFTPFEVGVSLAMSGAMGLLIQMVSFPYGDQSFGRAKSFSYALLLFPLAYVSIPFLASASLENRAFLWFCVTIVLLLQVLARTFSLPASFISPNDCSPHATVVCAFHGIGQSVTAPSNALGSSIGGALMAMSLGSHAIGNAWWAIAGVSVFGFASAFQLRHEKGRGPIILLQDDH